jgi:hypothetical protein
MTRMKAVFRTISASTDHFGAEQFCSTLASILFCPARSAKRLLCAFFIAVWPVQSYSVICYGVSFRMILATLLSFFPSSPSSRLISHRFEQVHYTPGEQCRRCGGVAPASFVETSTRTDHSLVPVSTNSVDWIVRLADWAEPKTVPIFTLNRYLRAHRRTKRRDQFQGLLQQMPTLHVEDLPVLWSERPAFQVLYSVVTTNTLHYSKFW